MNKISKQINMFVVKSCGVCQNMKEHDSKTTWLHSTEHY